MIAMMTLASVGGWLNHHLEQCARPLPMWTSRQLQRFHRNPNQSSRVLLANVLSCPLKATAPKACLMSGRLSRGIAAHFILQTLERPTVESQALMISAIGKERRKDYVTSRHENIYNKKICIVGTSVAVCSSRVAYRYK